MQIISRAEAKAAGLKRYFTGEPCKYGHVAEVQVSSNGCCECNKIKKKAKYQENLEASRAARRAYYAENTERVPTTRNTAKWHAIRWCLRCSKPPNLYLATRSRGIAERSA